MTLLKRYGVLSLSNPFLWEELKPSRFEISACVVFYFKTSGAEQPSYYATQYSAPRKGANPLCFPSCPNANLLVKVSFFFK